METHNRGRHGPACKYRFLQEVRDLTEAAIKKYTALVSNAVDAESGQHNFKQCVQLRYDAYIVLF